MKNIRDFVKQKIDLPFTLTEPLVNISGVYSYRTSLSVPNYEIKIEYFTNIARIYYSSNSTVIILYYMHSLCKVKLLYFYNIRWRCVNRFNLSILPG